MSQRQHSETNRKAWSHRAYEAWHQLRGIPSEAAAEIHSHPEHILRHTLPYHPHIDGQKIAVLLGSQGRRAIALALLGAEMSHLSADSPNT